MRVINLNRVVGGEMSRFTSVLFDLDGALVDPGQGIAGTIQFVLDSLGVASTKRLSSSYFFRQHIPQRPGEPVEFPHNKHVALAELNQEPMQFRSVPAPARRFLAIDSLAPHRPKRSHLHGGFLLARGDTGVAEQHCANVSPRVSIKQHLFATHQPA